MADTSSRAGPMTVGRIGPVEASLAPYRGGVVEVCGRGRSVELRSGNLNRPDRPSCCHVFLLSCRSFTRSRVPAQANPPPPPPQHLHHPTT